MLLTHRTLCALLLTAACGFGWSPATAEDLDPSGAPAGFAAGRAGETPSLPAGLDDTLSPLPTPEGIPATATTDRAVCDLAEQAAPAAVLAGCWEHLASLSTQERQAATLGIEPLDQRSAAESAALDRIAALWNDGHCDEALTALRRLEESGARVAIGIGWAPGTMPMGSREGTDVQIGAPETGVRGVDLDYHEGTGNLFSLVHWAPSGGQTHWKAYLSTNHGASWTQTYDWFTTTTLVKVDGAVTADWFYIGYVTNGAPGQLRVRRCNALTGQIDSSYDWKTALDAGTDTFSDMVTVSNADDYNNRIYFLGIEETSHALRYAWATQDGQTFNNGTSPTPPDCASNLSAAWGTGAACSEAFLFVAYVGTDDRLHILGYASGPGWTDLLVGPEIGADRVTSISAYEESIICAYETAMTHGRGIEYRISYDCGDSWSVGNLAVPDGVTTFSFLEPVVDARTGLGTAAVYQEEAGEPDIVYYRSRDGYAPGTWDAPVAFNDYDVSTGSDLALNPLSPPGVSYDLGAIYIAGSPNSPFFDQPARDFSAAPEAPVRAAALRLQPASPNPLRDQTTVSFELPAPAHVRLELFDLLGRRVATLLDEEVAAGPHEVRLDGYGLRGGLYLVRLTSGDETSLGRLIVTR